MTAYSRVFPLLLFWLSAEEKCSQQSVSKQPINHRKACESEVTKGRWPNRLEECVRFSLNLMKTHVQRIRSSCAVQMLLSLVRRSVVPSRTPTRDISSEIKSMSSQHRFRVLIFSLRVSPFLVSKWDKQRRRKRHMKHVWGQVSKEAKLKHFSSLLRKTHFLWFVTLLNNECRRARSSELSRWNRATTRFINDAESKGKISSFALCLHALRTCELFFRSRVSGKSTRAAISSITAWKRH